MLVDKKFNNKFIILENNFILDHFHNFGSIYERIFTK